MKENTPQNNLTQSSINNNDASTNNASPPPPSNDTSSSTQQHQRQPSLDMESFLRQWGGGFETNNIMDESSPTSVPIANTNTTTTSSSNSINAPPILMAENGPLPFLGRSQSTTPHPDTTATTETILMNTTNNDNHSTTHRRIASTGGNRLLNLPLPPSTTPTETPPPTITGSELHAAARITDWTTVHTLSLSSSSQTLAKYRGPDGWTALHHACSRRCPYPNIVESLIHAYPGALITLDDRGWTPLHHACRFKASKEVIRLLLRSYPVYGVRSAGMRCNLGRSSLYYAIRYEAPQGVVEYVLNADPSAVVDEDRDGMNVLQLVWDGYAVGFGGKRDLKALLRKFEGEQQQQQQKQQQMGVVDGAGLNALNEEEIKMAEKRVAEAFQKDTPALRVLKGKWRVVNNLLRAYFGFSVGSLDGEVEEEVSQSEQKQPSQQQQQQLQQQPKQKKRKWRILHAVSAIKCHHTLFLLARALHPEQATELDQNDLLLDAKGRNKPQCLSGENRTISNRTALHFAAMSPLSGKEGRNVIKTLLMLNPDAARHADGYGSLPLHLMAENEHKTHWINDGFRDVYNLYQEGSSQRDGLGRTPLHCATSCSGRYSNTAISSQPSPPPEEATPTVPNAPDLNNAVRNIGSVILNLVIVNRTAASIADNTGRLPLHYIAEHGEEWTNEASAILAAHPAASRTRAGAVAYHRLALHMAASNPDACPSLIRNIVDANPRAASIMDGTGRLPLFMACDSGRSNWDGGIESIYNAYNAAISMVEESPRRWTVLHTAAASHSAGRDLIETVLNLNRDAASVADGEGRYPLHLACAAGRHWEEGGLRLLFEADPSAALIEDKHGFLPLHIVAMKKPVGRNESRLSEEEMEEEVEASSESVEENDEEDLASLEALYNLLRAHPSTVHIR